MRIGIAPDHGGLELKVQLTAALKAAGYEVGDFGGHEVVTGDDRHFPTLVETVRPGTREDATVGRQGS